MWFVVSLLALALLIGAAHYVITATRFVFVIQDIVHRIKKKVCTLMLRHRATSIDDIINTLANKSSTIHNQAKNYLCVISYYPLHSYSDNTIEILDCAKIVPKYQACAIVYKDVESKYHLITTASIMLLVLKRESTNYGSSYIIPKENIEIVSQKEFIKRLKSIDKENSFIKLLS